EPRLDNQVLPFLISELAKLLGECLCPLLRNLRGHQGDESDPYNLAVALPMRCTYRADEQHNSHDQRVQHPVHAHIPRSSASELPCAVADLQLEPPPIKPRTNETVQSSRGGELAVRAPSGFATAGNRAQGRSSGGYRALWTIFPRVISGL